MDKRVLTVFLALVFSACQASPTPPAAPAELEVVLVTPALLPLASEWVQSFQEESGQIVLNLNPSPYPAAVETLEDGDAGVVIASQSPPPDWWAIPLGAEPIAIVVHPTNPVQQLSRNELIQILSGQATNWEPWTGQSQAIQVYFPIPGDDIRTRFLDLLSPGIRLVPGARLAPSPIALAELVAQEPGSIGILPSSLVSNSLIALEIDGFSPDEDDYGYSFEIIATAPAEPEGNIRTWLLWLQNGIPNLQPAPAETDSPTVTSESPIPTASDDPLGTPTAPPTRTPSSSQAP